MAPKASTSHLTPSAMLAEAVNSFTKAASLAFAAAEEQTKTELNQINEELLTMRRERDKNVKAMSRTQLQEKEWERHGELLQTSLEKSELTIKHQTETINQLRDEVTQWKNQLARLEETSRREIQDWKEQYLRAEQERSRLSSRIDELVAEQLQNANRQSVSRASTYILAEAMDARRQPPTMRKPRPSLPSDIEDMIPSSHKRKAKPQSATDRERTYVDAQPHKDVSRSIPIRSPKKRPLAEDSLSTRLTSPKKASSNKADLIARASASRVDHHAIQQPRQQLIRRVHAVVEVPVKEEVYSDEEVALASDGSDWQPAKDSSARRRRRSSVKSKPYVEIDEDEDLVEDDEDDQLLIGAEDNPSEIYGTQRVLVTEEVHPDQKMHNRKPAIPLNKKRKLNGESLGVQQSTRAKGSRK
ncbi:hypothetical protein BDW22DRAFT_1487354 [Trametopsis cervina]|nr:hypothetical protein BDW22DRAFT_1487354 [Trametopsis cervina]